MIDKSFFIKLSYQIYISLHKSYTSLVQALPKPSPNQAQVNPKTNPSRTQANPKSSQSQVQVKPNQKHIDSKSNQAHIKQSDRLVSWIKTKSHQNKIKRNQEHLLRIMKIQRNPWKSSKIPLPGAYTYTYI